MKKIPLTQGRFALVDDEDYDRLMQWKWSVDGSGYPQRATKTEKGWRPRRMHRDILGLVGRQMADHKNDNRLDNQKANLRVCTAVQNLQSRGRPSTNKSGFKGVSWAKGRNKWIVQICADYKRKNLGYYFCIIKAARAYDEAAIEYHGEFAHLNFPQKATA